MRVLKFPVGRLLRRPPFFIGVSKMNVLTAERLREAIEYDPETGDFRWRIGLSRRVCPGAPAGFIVDGYRRIGLDGKRYWAARLAWLYVHGVHPTGQIDHIDGDPLNNRISNLRDVSHAVNQQNQRRAHHQNKLGMLGVVEDKRSGKFLARIFVNGKTKFLGSYRDPAEAQQAYIEAKRALHAGCTI